jgi:hypothetical protein
MLRHPVSTRAASGYVTGQGHTDHIRYGGLGIPAPFFSTFDGITPKWPKLAAPTCGRAPSLAGSAKPSNTHI